MIKSFRQRAEELEKELGEVPLYINGKYSLEFEEWVRGMRDFTPEEAGAMI